MSLYRRPNPFLQICFGPNRTTPSRCATQAADPNTFQFICGARVNRYVRLAAMLLRSAVNLCHIPDQQESSTQVLPAKHPLARALAALAEADALTAPVANQTHDPMLFAPIVSRPARSPNRGCQRGCQT